MSIVGINLGAYDPSGVARVGGTKCIQTLWRADTLMICQMPRAGRIETASKDLVLSLGSPPQDLRLSEAVFFDPMDAMLPSEGKILVQLKLNLTLSSSVPSETVVDSMVDALIKIIAPSGLSVSGSDVFIKVGGTTISARRRIPPAPTTPSMQAPQARGRGSARARRQGANSILVETQVLQDEQSAKELVSVLDASMKDGSFLSALSATALPVEALELTQEIGMLSSSGVFEKCCCDQAFCPCYVCHETVSPGPRAWCLSAILCCALGD